MAEPPCQGGEKTAGPNGKALSVEWGSEGVVPEDKDPGDPTQEGQCCEGGPPQPHGTPCPLGPPRGLTVSALLDFFRARARLKVHPTPQRPELAGPAF